MVLIQTQLHMADTCFAFIVNVSGIGMLVEHCVRACILDHTQHTAPLVVNAVVHSHPRIQINTTHNCPDEQMCSLLSPTLTAKYCLFLFISLVCTHAFVRSCIMLEFFTFYFAVFFKDGMISAQHFAYFQSHFVTPDNLCGSTPFLSLSC